jgi:two-component system, cell cycle response regulator DivK
MPASEASDLAVLVIDDNPDNRLIVRELLKHECGVRHYQEASAGWQAFKQLRTQPPLHPLDLILLDLHIPGEDGYGVLTRIRGTAALTGTRVIAITASVGAEEIPRCRAAGFDGFIGKPIDVRRFPEQIDRILRGESVWEPG